MGTDWSTSYGNGRCVSSGDTVAHAHLLGGNVVLQDDVAASTVLCVVFFLAIVGVGWRWRQSRLHILLFFAVAFLFTGLAFAIRAGIANTSSSHLSRSAVLVEQIFFVLGQFLIIIGSVLYTRTFLSRATFVHWPRTLLVLTAVVVLLAFILDCVAFSRAPSPVTSYFPSSQYTQLRIAAAVLVFVLVTLNAVFLTVVAKIVAPELPKMEHGLLILSAWFLWVPAFYAFCVTAITTDTSALVCSSLFFYLSFGLFQLLSVAALLSLPVYRWGFTLARHDLVGAHHHGGAGVAHEAAHLQQAADRAWDARAAEDEQAELLRAEKARVGHNAAVAGFAHEEW